MQHHNASILVLGLGNDILGDDAVGLIAARILHRQFPAGVDFVESSVAGFALVDIMEGYERVLLLDAISTHTSPPGTIRELDPEDLDNITAYSPHSVGLPEILLLARMLDLKFPLGIRILAMEVGDACVLRESLSPDIARALPGYCSRASTIIHEWQTRHLTSHAVPMETPDLAQQHQ